MGYASYYENILEKYQSTIRDARAELKNVRREIERGNEAETRKRIASLQSACTGLERSLSDLERSLSSLLEIATHPLISVAQRYFEDYNRLNKLESDARQFIEAQKKDKEGLERAIASQNDVEIELRTRIILLEDENRKLRKRNKTIKEEVLYRKNPETLFPTVKPLKKKR